MSSVDKVKLSDDHVYDVSVSPTGTLDALSSNKFVSQDEDDPTKIVEYDDVEKITTADTHSTIFAKATKMIKNLRYLYQKIGDLSGLSESIASILARLDKKTSKTNYGYVKIGDGITVTDGVISAQSIIQVIHPVGSIYLSLDSTNPSEIFGGTWESIGQGRVLVGADGSEYVGGNTGGNKTHTIVETDLPQHKHEISGITKDGDDTSRHVHPVGEICLRSGSDTYYTQTTSIGTGATISNKEYAGNYGTLLEAFKRRTGSTGSKPNADSAHQHNILSDDMNCTTYGSKKPSAINLEQPYLVVYMWKRIA